MARVATALDATDGGEATIYLRHLQLAVKTVLRERDDLSSLFTPEEQELAALMLPDETVLSREARGLYCRMLGRKGPWFRLDSLVKYDELLSDWQEGGAHGVAVCERWQRAQRAVAELAASSLVSCIASPSGANGAPRPGPDRREVLDAIASCLRLDEIKSLLARVARHTSGNLSRREALAKLEQASTGQRTLTDFFKLSTCSGDKGAGGSEERLVKELAIVLAPSVSDTQACNGDPGSVAAGVHGTAGDVLLVKIQESGMRLFRRMTRLLYMGASGVHDVAGSGSMSVRSPIFNPALMADFGLVKYESYKCTVSVKLFGSRRRFLQWEAAVELRFLTESLLAHSFGCDFSADQVENLVRAIQTPVATVGESETAAASCANEEEIDLTVSPVQSKRVMLAHTETNGYRKSLARGRHIDLTNDGHGGSRSEKVCFAGSDKTDAGATQGAASVKSGLKGETSAVSLAWAIQEAREIFLSETESESDRLEQSDAHGSVDDPHDASHALILLSKFGGRLLRSYLKELVAQTDGTGRQGQSEIGDGPLLQAVTEICQAWVGGGKAYLRQLDAGYHLCSVVWCGIDALEKLKRYAGLGSTFLQRAPTDVTTCPTDSIVMRADCVPLLRLIVATPFLQHRRGRIYNRLALDLTHLGKELGDPKFISEALAVCEKALGDAAVTGGDRLTILKRRQRLQQKTSTSVPAVSHKSGSKDKGVCHLSDVSSDDFQQDSDKEREGRSTKKRGRSKRKPEGSGKPKSNGPKRGGHVTVEGCGLSERIGDEELVLLGILRDGGGYLSAFEGGGVALKADDIIEGTRLGKKVVGRKSRFAGFDTREADGLAVDDGQVCGVEELCLQHYMQSSQGSWYGLHCEGACFRTLFGILFWDVIFNSDVADVFLTPFQDAPLDLNSFPDFYRNRQDAIEARLELLKSCSSQQLLDLIAKCWREKFGIKCRGVNWQAWSLKFLQLVGVCVGGEGLAGISRTFCVNYRHFNGGLPDLVLVKAFRRRRCTVTQQVLQGVTAAYEGDWDAIDLDALVGNGGIASRGLAAREADLEHDFALVDGSSETRGLARRSKSQRRGIDSIAAAAEVAGTTYKSSENGPEPVTDMEIEGGVEGAEADGLELDQNLYEYKFAAKLVEVKGPNDTLMDRQTAWLAILQNSGIDARVCRVIEPRRSDCAPIANPREAEPETRMTKTERKHSEETIDFGTWPAPQQKCFGRVAERKNLGAVDAIDGAGFAVRSDRPTAPKSGIAKADGRGVKGRAKSKLSLSKHRAAASCDTSGAGPGHNPSNLSVDTAAVVPGAAMVGEVQQTDDFVVVD